MTVVDQGQCMSTRHQGHQAHVRWGTGVPEMLQRCQGCGDPHPETIPARKTEFQPRTVHPGSEGPNVPMLATHGHDESVVGSRQR